MVLRCEQCGWEVETSRPPAELPICGQCDMPGAPSNARLRPATCPGCDGTIARALAQGREVTTYKRCASCKARETAAEDGFRRAIFRGDDHQ